MRATRADTALLCARLIACAVALLVLPAQAARLALVIGNDTYQYTERLVNSRNDANAMAAALEATGFRVSKHLDLPREALFNAVDSFVLGVKKDDEVVVYFSGHGVQIDSAPYLLPTDIKSESSRQVIRDALALDSLVGDLSKARYTLIVVDACRDNPFAVQGRRGLGGERGLQPIEPPEGTAIIMSAGRGQTALDSLGPRDKEKNGVFTRELLRRMRVPGLSLRDLLLQVRDSVEQKAASVNHKQRPALVDETRGQFYFVPPAVPVAAAPAAASNPAKANDDAVEITLWKSVEASNVVRELQVYLNRYPAGHFSELARARIQRLGAASGTAAPATVDALTKQVDVAALRSFANGGSARAMANLGFLLDRGLGGLARNETEAAQWYRKAADAGDAAGMAGWAFMLDNGRGGVAKDTTQAIQIYRKAADAGSVRGMQNLAAAYAGGRGGLVKNEAEALKLHRRAIESDPGNGSDLSAPYLRARAMVSVGDMYMSGRGGLDRDDAQGLRWYRAAAEMADGRAMAALGWAYLNGRGVDKDEKLALEWLRKGVALDDPLAMSRLADMYLRGFPGQPVDENQAVQWFQRAAGQGAGSAMAALGVMHALGRGGLPADEKQAARWTSAAENDMGVEATKRRIADLRRLLPANR